MRQSYNVQLGLARYSQNRGALSSLGFGRSEAYAIRMYNVHHENIVICNFLYQCGGFCICFVQITIP